MKRYVADFETTTVDFTGLKEFIEVNKNFSTCQNSLDWWKKEYITNTKKQVEVWSAAICEVGCLEPEKVEVLGSIKEFYEYIVSFKDDSIVYFHNLQFDGSFIIDFLLKSGYKEVQGKAKPKPKTFNILITGQGRWFNIVFITKSNHKIQIWNSLNLLPFSLKLVGEGFKTKYQKTSMDFGHKFVGYKPTEEELEYIRNDVLVLSEALDLLIKQGNDRMTIGSCCLNDFKERLYNKYTKACPKLNKSEIYRTFFPDLTKIELDEDTYGAFDVDCYIRDSYRGGWCYVNPKYQGYLIEKDGCVFDFNSMHPSMMKMYSYPIGKPKFWEGNYLPEVCNSEKVLYFIRIKTKFDLKPDKFPCIQIKNNVKFKSNEWLTTSKTCLLGREFDERIELTLTQVDYEMILESYELTEFEILDGCYFQCAKGLFDDYIDYWAKIKENSKGSMRQLAKLFLNNFYGKFGTNRISEFKIPKLEDEKVVYETLTSEKDKMTEYVAVAAFVTAYSRYTVIKAANDNYKYFAYADTDSIHCICKPEFVNTIECHDTKLCYWKKESEFKKAKYLRQKTYIELVVENGVEAWEVKCAGMSENCKKLLLNQYTEEECEALGYNYTLHDIEKEFDVGLSLDGKLMPYRIPGGIVLINTKFTMKK